MRILVVRRDNIGDLVCTTPLLTALRKKYPQAWIAALVNSYNAPVLQRNPDIDDLFVYTKLKHAGNIRSFLSSLADRFAMIIRLRRRQLDYVILASTDFVPRLVRFAKLIGARTIIGFSDGSQAASAIDLAVPSAGLGNRHEVERVFEIARKLGVEGEIPAPRIYPDPLEVERANAAFPEGRGKRIALHISARRPAQRWPAENFARLIERLRASHQVLLLWSPGAEDDARHPGDESKAALIKKLVPGVAAYRTNTLQELIGALAACDVVVCSDGGTSHLAAALGKPIVCFFGDSSVQRWRPWGVPSRILQPASRRVEDLTVEEVAAAAASLT